MTEKSLQNLCLEFVPDCYLSATKNRQDVLVCLKLGSGIRLY